jgi:hypothetical protein
MTEVLYTGRLSGPNLTQLIHACDFPPQARFLGEQLPKHMVDEAERQNLLLFDWYSATITFTNYNTGRIFQPDGELRWERSAEQFHIVYLGSDQRSAALERHTCRKKNDITELINRGQIHRGYRKYCLFGKFLNRDIKSSEKRIPYAERRIPRILYYPLDIAEEQRNIEQGDQLKRLGIKTIEYTYTASGQIFAYRFETLEVMKFTTLNKGA